MTMTKKMAVPFLDLHEQYREIGKEIETVTIETLRSCEYILGSRVKEFEEKFSAYSGARYSLGCASGTDALLLSAMARNIGPGDEVISTPFTFFATVGVIARLGGKPIFVDIEEDSFNIDLKQVEKKITKNTKAVIPVHLFGLPVDMDRMMKIVEGTDIWVIEDACQAAGASFKGKMAGTIGHTGCFSFYPTKNLSCAGDGGLITTNSPHIQELLRMLRVHGTKKKYFHDIVGINSRLDAIQAAILSVKLRHLDDWNHRRRIVAATYNRELAGREWLRLPVETTGSHHIYHQYVLKVPEKARDRFMEHLTGNGIDVGVYYPKALHIQECFKQLNYDPEDCKVAFDLTRRVISLPIFPEMTEEQVSRVIDAVKSFEI